MEVRFGRWMDAEPGSKSLAELRAELARVDREIVRLVSARLRLARSAIRLRLEAGESVTNRVQERLVRDRAHRWAIELGVSPELIDRLFRDVVQCGKAGAQSLRSGPSATARQRTAVAAALVP